MNDPEATRQHWSDVLWDVFVKRCKADFDFDPVADGVLVAAERLAKRAGKWAAVSVLYHDSFGSFPHVFTQLAKLQPPPLSLFPDYEQLAGYPQINAQGEANLRHALSACAAMDAPQARMALAPCRKGTRGAAHLALGAHGALPAGCRIGTSGRGRSAQCKRADWANTSGTHSAISSLDGSLTAALQTLAAVHTRTDLEAVSGALQAIYLPWLNRAPLAGAAKAAGGLPLIKAETTTAGTCTVFVDGLRYDLAVQLVQQLSAFGNTHLSARWTSLPSVTASGKA